MKISMWLLLALTLTLLHICYFATRTAITVPRVSVMLDVTNQTNVSQHSDIKAASFTEDTRGTQQVLRSEAHRCKRACQELQAQNSKLVQFINQHNHSVRTSSKLEEVVLSRADHFGGRMQQAAIRQFALEVDEGIVEESVWALRTASWWSHVKYKSMSHETIVDMGKKTNYYQSFSKEFASGNFVEAAKLLSPYAGGVDAWPSVAVIENAIIFGEGQIRNESHIVHGKGCRLGRAALSFNRERKSWFHTVATIADFWGYGYFHFVAENLVRLPLVLPVIEHLNRSMVHVHRKNGFVISLLGAAGVPSHRVIEGIVSADVALLPEPIPCGTPPAILLQLLRRTLLLNHQNFGVLKHVNLTEINFQILLVKRQGSRSITNHDALASALKTAFRSCQVVVHTGRESIIEQMRLFRASSVVIAPHGAGLTNIVVCRKRTLLLEFMLPGPAVNICYMSMAFKLGLDYLSMAIPGSSHSGMMSINVVHAIGLLQSVLRSWPVRDEKSAK